MLRINLLPAYIAEQKKTRNAIVANCLLFAAVLGVALFVNFSVAQQAQTRQQEADAKQAEADKVTAFASETSALRAKVAPLKEKVDFVKVVRFHNTVRQRIFRKAAEYTYRDVEYNQMSVTGNVLAMSGYVKKLSDIGRTYITFYGNPDVTAVSITGMPGWPTAEQRANEQGQNPFGGGQPQAGPLKVAYPIRLTATLVRPVQAPQLPAGLAGGTAALGGGAPGAIPGPPPGVAGPPPGEGPPPDR